MSAKYALIPLLVMFLGACENSEGNTSPMEGYVDIRIDEPTKEVAETPIEVGPYAKLEAAFNAEPQDTVVINDAYSRSLELYGRGEYKESSELLIVLSDNGHVDAKVLLADHYRRGAGTDVDLKKSAELFEDAVAEGNIIAHFALGNLLYDGGDSLEEDRIRALELWRTAADAGYQPALDKLTELR